MERVQFQDGSFWCLNDIKEEWKVENEECLVQTEKGNFIHFYRNDQSEIIIRTIQALDADEAAEWFVSQNLDSKAPDYLASYIEDRLRL